MSQTIKLKKGFDLNLAGKAENKTIEVASPDTYALKPTDFWLVGDLVLPSFHP